LVAHFFHLNILLIRTELALGRLDSRDQLPA
jgi:hypothetical protein